MKDPDLLELEMSLLFTVTAVVAVVIIMFLILPIVYPYLLERCLFILIWGCSRVW